MKNSMYKVNVWPGKPYPLGATWDGEGVNFALFSDRATGVELCLFDSADPRKEQMRVRMTEQTDNVWHAYLPDLSRGRSTATGFTGRSSRRRAALQPEQALARSLRQGDRRADRLG